MKSGRYISASEVIREALHLLDRFDEARQRGIVELNRKIDESLAQAEGGEIISGEESLCRSRAARAKLTRQG